MQGGMRKRETFRERKSETYKEEGVRSKKGRSALSS